MIVNGTKLLEEAPIEGMSPRKNRLNGLSWGLSEVGYDIRVKQEIRWTPPDPVKAMQIWENRGRYGAEDFDRLFQKAFHGFTEVISEEETVTRMGRTALASSLERFTIPKGLWCEYRNKSTHARCFIDATIGTDGEPGWSGYLTIEAIFHSLEPIVIKAGSPILKAVFHQISEPAAYGGKYQDQANCPVGAIFEEA